MTGVVFSQVRDIFRQLCADETRSIEYRRDQWRLRYVRHPSNPDPLYWDERGFTWRLLWPPSPISSEHSPSEEMEDEEEEIITTPPEIQLPEEDRFRLTDLRRRQSESEARAEKVWKDLEDFHGWTDRGREAYGIAHHGNLGRRNPPWEKFSRVSRDHYLLHMYPTV
jgi:hypothetical protein